MPQKLEIINSKNINATASTDMTDVLKKNTTVNVIQYPGLLSGVSIRGFRPQFSGLNQRTLLLVNGRTAGATNMGFLDLNNVQRIEVLKGPASALYGSQAMGGVINIITPQSSGIIRGKLNASYGSFDTYNINGHVGGSVGEKVDFDVSAGIFKRTSNFRLGKGNFFRNMLKSDSAKQVYSVHKNDQLADSTSYTQDISGDGQIRPYTKYGFHTLAARVGYNITKNWRIDASASSFAAKNVESPGELFKDDRDAGLKDVYRQSADLSLSGHWEKHELLFRGYFSKERSDAMAVRNAKGEIIDTPYLARRSDYKWHGFQARDAITFGNHKLIAGYDFNYAYANLTIFPAPVDKQRNEYTTAPNSSLVTHGIYIQAQLAFLANKLRIHPGVRLDNTVFNILKTPGYKNELKTGRQSNLFVSPSLSAQYTIASSLVIHASAGRAFITPDASNVAGETILGKGTGKATMTKGNPDLKNESSWSQDIGFRFNNVSKGIAFDITYFATQVKDRITSKSLPPKQPLVIEGDNITAVTSYYNSDKSYIKGLEVMAAYDIGALSGYKYSLRPFINITHFFRYEDTKVNSAGVTETAQMPSVAKINTLYGIDFAYKKFNTKISGRYVGKRWDKNYNDNLRPLIEYPAFMTMDFYASYKITLAHQLGFYLENITDENYYEKRGYNMAGRNFKLKYTFNF